MTAAGRVPLPVVTERCLLRLPRLTDAERLHREVYGDAEVMRYAGPGPHRDVETTREVLRRYRVQQRRLGYGMWVVQTRADGRLLGECGLQPLAGELDEVEIGCTLARAAWGRGLAVELTSACVRLAFTVLELDRVFAVVRPDNAASRAVTEKLGMRLTGHRDVYGGEHLLYQLDRPRPAPGPAAGHGADSVPGA